MDKSEPEAGVEQVAEKVRANWGWLMAMGVAMVILGVAGLYMTWGLTLVSILWFGFIVFAGGVLMLLDAFKAEGWKAKITEILLALLYLVAGIIIIANPAGSAAWFTLFIAAFLLATGIFRIVLGFQVRKEVDGWMMSVFGGACSIILGVLILAKWPVSGLWVIGLFVAIEMLFQGISMISIASAARSSAKPREPASA